MKSNQHTNSKQYAQQILDLRPSSTYHVRAGDGIHEKSATMSPLEMAKFWAQQIINDLANG